MEEVNSSHSVGSGQPHQHPVHHSRPFFYVQPPSQPYYMYQWQINNLYGPYGFPGSGLHFGRPYASPFAYMQYPGYVIPQVPMQPVEYRRLFNPYVLPATAYDLRFHHGQSRMQREMACSEAQTEPNDKITESMNNLEVCEVSSLAKDPDSGVVSHSSSVCLPGDEQKCDGKDECVAMENQQLYVPLPAEPTSDLYDVELGQSHVNLAQPEAWQKASDVILPLHDTSVHEDTVLPCGNELAPVCVSEELGLATRAIDEIHTGTQIGHEEKAFTSVQSTLQDCETYLTEHPDPSWVLPEQVSSYSSCSGLTEGLSGMGFGETNKMPPPSVSGENCASELEELPYRILRLPYEQMAPVGLLRDDPMWCVDQLSTLVSPIGYLSSLNAHYSYYSQTAQERQSVLSPSLDELSSRDETFSTDLEDMDLMSGHMYIPNGKMGGASALQEPMENLDVQSSSEEECSVCSRSTCATCGSILYKKQECFTGDHLSLDKGDIDEGMVDNFDGEIVSCESQKVPVKQFLSKRHVQAHSRQTLKKSKNYVSPEDAACFDALGQECMILSSYCGDYTIKTRAEKCNEQEPRSSELEPHLGQYQGTMTSDQDNWETCGMKKSKTWKPPSSQGQDIMATSHQHSGNRPHAQNVPEAPSGSIGGPHTESSYQSHQESHPPMRPFFYVQPSQPYIPYQWHVPMTYSPYCTFPSFAPVGYGIVMPPNVYSFPPNPYVEAPAYVIPQTQLHLTDYRRMLNPHFPPTMAYHTRRFRYQHVAAPRETISSEVQTEASSEARNDSQLSGASESCVGESLSLESDSGKGSGCTNASSGLEMSTQHGKEGGLHIDEDLMSTLPQAAATPKGAYVFQREEVRIECTGTPSALKIVHSHETAAESIQDASGDLAQCDVWSVSSAEGVIPLYCPSAPAEDTIPVKDEAGTAGKQGKYVPSYPDILLVGGSPSGGTDSKAKVPCIGVSEALSGQPLTDLVTDLKMVDGEMLSNTTLLKEACFKILRLPFEMQPFKDLQTLQESVDSLIPSVGCQVLHVLMEAEKKHEKATCAELVEPHVGKPHAASAEMTPTPSCIPSASWLADFGNLSQNVQDETAAQFKEQLAVTENTNEETKCNGVTIRLKEQKHIGEVDFESPLSQSPNRSALSHADGGERNCHRCLTKQNTASSPNLKAVSVRRPKVMHSSPDDLKLQSHVACRCCMGRALRKGYNLDVLGYQTMDEEMENKAMKNIAHLATPRRLSCKAKRPVPAGEATALKSHSDKCSVKCSKLREKNCACKEPSVVQHQHGVRVLHDAVRRHNENILSSLISPRLKTREQLRTAHKLQTESSRRGSAVSDKEMSENEARQRNLKLTLCSQPQEKHLKTTTQQTQNEIGEPVQGYFSHSSWTKTGANRRDTRC